MGLFGWGEKPKKLTPAVAEQAEKDNARITQLEGENSEDRARRAVLRQEISQDQFANSGPAHDEFDENLERTRVRNKEIDELKNGDRIAE